MNLSAPVSATELGLLSAEQTTKQIFRGRQVVRQGHWRFAQGEHALYKAVFEQISDDPEALQRIASITTTLAVKAIRQNGSPPPDLVAGVPNGANCIAESAQPLLQEQFGHPVRQVFTAKLKDSVPVEFLVTDAEEQIGDLASFGRSKLYLGIFEDITTTWQSARRSGAAIVEAARQQDIEVVPLLYACVAERQGTPLHLPSDPMKLKVLDLFVDQWPQADCTIPGPITPSNERGEPAPADVVEQILNGWPES